MAQYLIKYSKNPEIKYVGHLDLLKAIQRTFLRADVGEVYSKGFNPHMQMSIAQPLPVGTSSECEYMTCELETGKTEEELLNDLRSVSPLGIGFINLMKVPDRMETPMALLRAIRSEIRIPSDDKLYSEIVSVLSSSEPMKIKVKSKKGVESEKDLRPMIVSCESEYEDGYTVLDIVTHAGSVSHLSLNHLIDYIDRNTSGLDKERFIAVMRKEMYTDKGNGLMSIEDHARYEREKFKDKA